MVGYVHCGVAGGSGLPDKCFLSLLLHLWGGVGPQGYGVPLQVSGLQTAGKHPVEALS